MQIAGQHREPRATVNRPCVLVAIDPSRGVETPVAGMRGAAMNEEGLEKLMARASEVVTCEPSGVKHCLELQKLRAHGWARLRGAAQVDFSVHEAAAKKNSPSVLL